MPQKLLIGVGGLIVFLIIALVMALGFKRVSEDFATQLAQMILPTLPSFAGTI